jgi:hypothetical protein
LLEISTIFIRIRIWTKFKQGRILIPDLGKFIQGRIRIWTKVIQKGTKYIQGRIRIWAKNKQCRVRIWTKFIQGRIPI